jgi:hypothetical protein
MDDDSWKENLYNEVFNSRLEYLKKRRERDSSFSITDMEKILSAEYKKQDLAWAGKSPIQEITDSATIAAYEHFLAQW